MRFIRAHWVAMGAVLAVLVVFVSGLAWYDSRIDLIATDAVFGKGPDDWLLTMKLDAPLSIWRYFFRVQDASHETWFYASAEAWRNDPTALQDIPTPVYGDDNRPRATLRGSMLPLNILLAIRRTNPYVNTDDEMVMYTATYTVVGFRRQIVLKRWLRRGSTTTERRWLWSI